ncbi:MAG: hypothetical protein KAW41_03900 [Candidatus Diapherotrites archaeon]|nr:hypothetical protein [Candidatus Diapherotrites archaeon]
MAKGERHQEFLRGRFPGFPKEATPKELRKLIIGEMGKPKNEVDRDILRQLVGLAGKKVVLQYGVHLNEKIGKLTAMLARKNLEDKKEVGFIELNGVCDIHRDALINSRARKYSKPVPTDEVLKQLGYGESEEKYQRWVDKGLMSATPRELVEKGVIGLKPDAEAMTRAEEELIKENIIPSEGYDRPEIHHVVYYLMRPEHYIDVHGDPRFSFDENKPPFELLTDKEEHRKVAKSLKDSLEIKPAENLAPCPPADMFMEVLTRPSKVEQSEFTPKEVEEYYNGLERSGCFCSSCSLGYAGAQKLNKENRETARQASEFLVKFVNKLLEE